MKKNNKITIYIFRIMAVAFFMLGVFGFCEAVRVEAQETESMSTASTVSSSSQALQDSSTLLFLGNQNIAPIVFLEGDEPVGLAVDITKALALYLSRPIEIRAMDWSIAQTLVADGKADVLVQINQTEERKKIYDFSDTLLESQFSIFANTDRIDILGLTSLHGLKVGVEKGGLPQKTLEGYSDIELVIIPNFLEGFKELEEKAIDAIVVDYRVGSYVLAKNNIQNIRAVGDPIAFSYSSFAVKKGNTELLNEINFALQTIKSNGMYQAILNKWQKTEVVIKTREQITRAIYVAIIAVLLMLSLLVVAWSTTVSRELSRRKVAEKDLATTIGALREAQSMTHLGSWELNLVTNKLTWSDEIFKIFEIDQQKFGASYEAFLNAIHPDDRDMVNTAYTESVKNHKPYSVDHRLLMGDGRIKYVHERCETFYDKDDKPLRSVGTVQDVTERYQADAELRESEEKYRVLLQKIKVAVVVHGADTQVLTTNTMAQELLGLTEEQMLGKMSIDPAWHFSYEDGTIMPVEEYPVNRVISTGVAVRDYVIKIHRTQGAPTVWVLVNADPVFDEHQNIILVIVTFVDITKRKDAEQELRDSEEKFSAAFHVSPNLIAITRLDNGEIVDVNEGYTELLGYSREESLGKTTSELSVWASPDDRQRFAKELRETGKVDDFETKLRRKDGALRTVIDSARALEIKGGRYILSIAYDITERKLEEERLKELDKLKDDFLMVTTHELKSPLIPIKSQAQLFLAGDYGELSQEQRSAMEMILRNEETINELANEVLDISKIKSNKLKLVLGLEDVGKIVTEAVDELRGLSVQKHLSVTLRPIPVLPKIMVDRLRVKQVLLNILGNAIKFTPDGGSINIEVSRKGNEIEVRVSDTGIGIIAKDIEKLFIPFSRIESDITRKYRGTGLGLAISKGLVETHGGRIWAESDGVGKGSTFVFTLLING